MLTASNVRLKRRLGDRTHAATLLHGLNVRNILEPCRPSHDQHRCKGNADGSAPDTEVAGQDR